MSKLEPDYTIAEIAVLLRLSSPTVYEKLRSGKIPGRRDLGGAIRINRKVFDEWFQKGGRPDSQAD